LDTLITARSIGSILQADSRSVSQEHFRLLWITRRFVTVFTGDRKQILSWASWNQSTNNILYSVSISCYNLHPCLQSSAFPSGFLTTVLCVFLISTRRQGSIV
jgi:hypothetical protein